MAGRDSGRDKSQIRLLASRSWPSASVAKLRLHKGSRKVAKVEKTTQLEKIAKPEPATTAWNAPTTAVESALAPLSHGSCCTPCKSSRCSSNVGPKPRGERQC